MEQLESITQIIAFLNCDENNESSAAKHLLAAKEYFQNENLDLTLDELIKAVMIDKMYCEELPRKTAIALFRFLGSDHEITKKYRRRFDMALY
jgi:putative thioredoxin